MNFDLFIYLFYNTDYNALSISARNLALYGKATQSDLVENPWSAHGHAINATDGNRDSNFEHESCTNTKIQDDPWWRLDLLDSDLHNYHQPKRLLS